MVFITGLIGIAGFAAFLGFMLWWVKALPLIIIVLLVGLLLAYDWIMTVRYGDAWETRK